MTDTINTLDLRINAYRTDLADERLRGQVEAARFVPGDDCQVYRESVPLYGSPDFDAQLLTEALHGEVIKVFEINDGWAWGQLARDHYVGYMPLEGISPGVLDPTHRVSALRTFVYDQADIKSPPVTLLSLNSEFNAVDDQGEFYKLQNGHFIVKRHCKPVQDFEHDFVSVAERFIGTPYLWGGRTSLGLDCSALVQLACEASGIKAPRDSDMQQRQLGHQLHDSQNLSELQRGDLIFWRGHVGVMQDESHFLHANAYHMEVVSEGLERAISRIEEMDGGAITAIKRLSKL